MARFKLKSAFVSWIFLSFVISTTSGQQVGTSCSDPRIRRSWDTYNSTEKNLYLEAVGIAMDKGFHQKFIQIHTEYLSEKQAHGNCMFIYWHRAMLLGYENMLRSLDLKYQCLTLPYWDHLSAQARFTANNCTGLLSCTPFLTDSGGDMTGVNKNLIIYNVTIPSYSGSTTCITQGVLSHFCGNSTCANCVTRKTKSTMASTKYPDTASFGSVFQQVFSSNDSYTFTSQVERNVHNMIHSTLDGVMGYFQSPADPIFYLHHALIDLLQVIYLKCQVGGENILLSSIAKGSDPRWFSQCLKRYPTNQYYTVDDTVTTRALAFDGKTYVNVWQNPNNTLYPFFKDLPSKYADYVDAKDLGNYSYTYAISGGLANLYQNCWKATTKSAVNSTVTALMADEGEIKFPRGDKGQLYPVIESGTSYDEKVKRWNIALYEAARIVGYEETAAREQMEMVGCQYQEDCLGGVQDYTPLFQANFGVEGHPRCYTLLQYLNSGERVIGIPQWKEITNRFLPCSAYKRKIPLSGFEKAVSELKKGFESGKSLDDYVTNKVSASA